MTATELFEALHGLPSEATCGTIHYRVNDDRWFARCDTARPQVVGIATDHAAALQRDALTDYLCRIGTIHIKTWPDGCAVSVPQTFSEAHGTSRTLALIAAVRYVAGEGK